MDLISFSVLVVSLGSYLVSQWIFHAAGPRLSRRLVSAFVTFTPKQRAEWSSRLVSTVHALVVGFLCLYILVFDEATKKDPIWGDPTLVKVNVAMTTGYLISDLLLMIYFWEFIGEKYFVIHHLAALYAYYYVLSQGILPYFANFRLLAEFSTPFVNQRWFLQTLGYHKVSRPNLVNGVAMAFTFFLVRIAVIPVYYSQMYSVFGTEAFYRLTPGARCAWIISSVCLDVMNIMWMRRILRGCLKVLSSRRMTMESRKMD
ncbi:transmembrane protein 56-B-like [Trichomycterus rosablanca]|uniref:transmembrane protein 56-B-like n=1 Tax=Trichomycterus rosablanca TaxID=2290929 RepID=UPI002F35FB7D